MANKKSDIKLYSGLRFGKMTIVNRDDEASENVPNHNYEIFVVQCDCGKIKSMTSTNIRTSIRNGSNSTCGLCVSFYDWCIKYKRYDFLDLWDYELNNCSPKDITYGSGIEYYFQCKNNPRHTSEKHRIDKLTRKGKLNDRLCSQCDSIGQHIIDIYGEGGFCEMWSKSNEADPFKILKNSKTKIKIKCKDCKHEKVIIASNLVWQGLSCSCGDGLSYPNKFITELLRELKIDFKSEEKFNWSNDKRYDHYIPQLKIIIENHGEQHYYGWCGDKENFEIQQLNDRSKRQSALDNGIEHYIQLDCRKSDMEWIKNSVMNSELPDLLGFEEEDIDWLECDRCGLKNLIKEAGLLWMTRRFESTTMLGDHMGINKNVICQYLKRASNAGWCDYDPKVEKSKASRRAGKSTGIPIYAIVNGVNTMFESATECAKQSMDVFGIKLTQTCISKACRANKQYKGFTFRYVDSPEQSTNEQQN